MLHIENISKTFFPGTINEKRALQHLSLHLKPGDFVTVIGGNGAGKSTMLNAVAGVFPIELINNFIKNKREECRSMAAIPHPAEFDKYYNL